MGSGIVIARLPDGSWSAPSCIGTGGVGFGLQIGAVSEAPLVNSTIIACLLTLHVWTTLHPHYYDAGHVRIRSRP